jgi:transcriptional regulator with XRE-family HTH domain
MIDKKIVAKRVQMARMDKGFTQEQLAAKIKRPRIFVARIEGGKFSLDSFLEVAELIGGKLNKSPEYFLQEDLVTDEEIQNIKFRLKVLEDKIEQLVKERR